MCVTPLYIVKGLIDAGDLRDFNVSDAFSMYFFLIRSLKISAQKTLLLTHFFPIYARKKLDFKFFKI